MGFPHRLRELRKEKKLTQEELGSKINVTKVSVSGYENGNRNPDTETLQKLADYFNVSTDYLLGRTDNPYDRETTHTIRKEDLSSDSLSEINKLVKEYGIDQLGFFNIEKWKNLSPEDLDEIKRHFEWVAQKAKERNEKKK